MMKADMFVLQARGEIQDEYIYIFIFICKARAPPPSLTLSQIIRYSKNSAFHTYVYRALNICFDTSFLRK